MVKSNECNNNNNNNNNPVSYFKLTNIHFLRLKLIIQLLNKSN
jgi:hypothetical protein